MNRLVLGLCLVLGLLSGLGSARSLFHSHPSRDCDVSKFRFQSAAFKNEDCQHIKTGNARDRLCFLVPSTTHGLKPSAGKSALSAEELPLMTKLVASANAQSDPSDKETQVELFVFFDEGDAFYDNEENRKSLMKLLDEKDKVFLPIASATSGNGSANKVDVNSHATTVKMQKFPKETKGSLTKMWNFLFEEAFKDGCDYFFQIGDDVQLVSKGWVKGLLGKMKKHGDFGVVGPSDTATWVKGYVEQAIVSRLHYSMLHILFDPSFPNYSCDVWLSNLYGPAFTTMSKKYQVTNNIRGGRYSGTIPDHAKVRESVREARERICEYLKFCKNPKADEICAKMKSAPNNALF